VNYIYNESFFLPHCEHTASPLESPVS